MRINKSAKGFLAEVRAEFIALGYEVRPAVGPDMRPIDFIATRGTEVVAVAAEDLDASDALRLRVMDDLDKSAARYDCNRAVLATSASVDPGVFLEAARLRVEVQTPYIRAVIARALAAESAPQSPPPDALPAFEEVWRRSVMPLAGQRVSFENGNSMQVVKVDWEKVTRISSTGRRSQIPIDPFLWAIEQIRSFGSVTRAAIHEAFNGRYSSAVTAILAEVPELELQTDPHALVRRRSSELPVSDG